MNTLNYTTTQRQAYLNNYFLTNTTALLDYFILTSQTALFHIKEDIQTMISWHANVLYICSIILLVYCAVLILLRKGLVEHYKDKTREMKGLFELISCRTIVESEAVKKEFDEEKEEFKLLK